MKNENIASRARTAIIVLGMHRSGTSATAGLFGEMGCDLPNTLMAPHDMNAKGFFESNTITLLNDEILASAGMTWFDLNCFPGPWYSSPKAPEFKEKARTALNDEFGASDLFVLKDPRHCRLVPFWEEVFTEEGVQPVYICIHRNPIEVAASLQKWHGTELLYGQLLWLRHVLDAEITTRGKKRVFVSYDQILSDWRDVVGRISNNLDLVFPRSLATAARGVHKFLSGELRHFSSVSLMTRELGETSDWLMETWEVLNRWSRTGEDAAGHATLDNVRDAINAASATIVSLANNLLARYHESGHQSEQIAALNVALTNNEEMREQQSAQLNLVNAALADSEETRERQSAQLNLVNAALADSEEMREQQSAQLNLVNAALADSEETRERQSAQLNLVNAALADGEETRERQSAQLNLVNAALADSEETRTSREVALFKDITWMSVEIVTLQRCNWMSRAPLAKLLRRLVKVRLLYALSRSTLFSDRRRAKFLRSAEKRDPMLLSARLDRFCQDYHSRIDQSSFLTIEERNHLISSALRVTAIVPNFNHARYLRQRLDSILSQTYPLIDIIVLDDCSTDDSRLVINDYLARYPDRIKAFYNDANSGSVFRQWQKGHELATGDLVWFCESDDFCTPSFVERLIGHFRDPSLMLAFGQIEFVDDAGTVMPGMAHYLETAEAGIWDQPILRTAATWFKGAFGVKNVIANVGGSLWRRAPLSQDIWDEASSFRIMGDWYLYSVVANGGQIAFNPAAQSYFRIHGQNKSGAKAQGTPDYYLEYTRLMTALKQRWPIPDETIDRFVDSCNKIYRGASIKSPPFEKLVAAQALKAVKTEKAHILMGMLGFSYGGGEIFPIHLANALHKRGVMVSMLTMMDTEDHPDVRAMLNPAIPVYSANGARDMGVGNFVTSAGITVIHSHIASIEMLLLDEGKVDLPYLSTLHGSYEAMDIPKLRVAAWAAKIDCFGFLTERNLVAFAKLATPQEKFRKLRNAMPIDPRPYRMTRSEMNISEDAVVFTLVGRGVAGKGWLEAVKAFKTLRARRPDVPMALIAAGDGPLTVSAREIAGLDPDIHFLGFDNAVHGIYRISDVALIPTRFAGESYPLCLIQAMQVGIPAIATDIGEISKMISRGGNEAGVTVPYLADDEAFITAIVEAMELMLEPDLRARLANGAAVLGKDFDMDSLAGDYLALYQEILQHRDG